MRRSTRPVTAAWGAVLACGALVLAGCTTPSTAASGDVAAATASATATATPTPTPRAAQVIVAPGDGTAAVRPDTPVAVRATVGGLDSVQVVAVGIEGAVALPGMVSADGMSWVASASMLPGTTYAVTVQAHGEPGSAPTTLQSGFSTLASTATVRAKVSPLDGETVGVGMPIQVSFTGPIPQSKRAQVERRMTVTTSVPVEGSWNWTGERSVRWRPKDYWPTKTQVTLSIPLTGLDLGNGAFGDQDRTIGFTVGRSVISVVDIAAHRMQVYLDGGLAKTLPVTTGKVGFATRSGTKVIVEKFRSKRMDAATTGIDSADPEYYNIADVEYAMRLTYSGEFIHAAPWSVGSQGRDNVSHGCTGMSTANAAWLYGVSKRGDVVRYVNSGRGLEPGNGWTDWEVSWDRWRAGSALT